VFAAVLLVASAVFYGSTVSSQTAQLPTPTPEQLQLFQSLPQEQQDALLKQLGVSGGAAGLGSLGAGSDVRAGGLGGLSGTDSDRSLDRMRTSPLGVDLDLDEDADVYPPVLKEDDWVIIEVDFSLPARPTTDTATTAASPMSASAAAVGAGAKPAAGLTALTANPQSAVALPPPPPPPANDEQKARTQALIELIRAHNPYRLSGGGLTLPGFAPIPLLGLSNDQATLRLRIEPGLRNVDIRLTRLPLKKSGAEGLKPFGYDLFARRAPSTFAPSTNVPVPSDYIVGAGDELNVQLYGNQNRSLKLVVARDGHVNLPDLGPISVSGQRFTSVKSEIESRIERQMIGVHASVSMGDTRSIRVFVLGEARRPGSYTISGLGTITSALYVAGGVKRIGSLRNIQLKRQGVLARRLDLYDLLIRGDSSDDAKLQQGDVIFIPPVSSTVSIDGEVRRPAIYEIRNEASVADLIQLAGGLTAVADREKAMLTRIDEDQRRVVIPVNLTASARSEALRNGDLLRVPRLRPTLDSGISVSGHVYTPGNFAWRPGIRISSIITSVDELRPNADIHYLLIRREVPPDRHVDVVSADLAAALAQPGSKADIELMPRDRITVFDLESGRDRIIQPIMDELRLQASSGHLSEVVTVDGRVKVPGEYPLEPGMTVADLVRAGGGTADAAYGAQAELIRYKIVDGDSRQTELINVDLSAALRGDPSANLVLMPFDTLSVKEIPLWTAQESVTLRGEVHFPGVYSIRRGETLKSVIARAGGLTKYAFPEGSVFTRDELRRREQEQLDMLADRMQRDLALLALQSAAANQSGAGTALTVGQSLLEQLKGAQAVGRLVIDLPKLENSPIGSAYDVSLRGGDTLSVPRFEQQVTVIGEVQTNTSHLYNAKLTRDGYISLSGGTTRRADRSKIYIVRANGSVVASQGSRWFERSDSVQIKPGDTIVVPLDTEHIPALPLWTQVTQILYNLAIAVLAVHSI
jgi:protein involved in polysaccharide export with SLBB domain